MTPRSISRPLFTLAAIALSGSIALAQQTPAPQPAADSSAPQAAPIERQAPPAPDGAAPRPRAMRPGAMRGGPGGGMMANRDGMRGGPSGGMGGGFRIGPGGMWWKNPRVVQALTLTPDQIKRMDGIFQQSRLQLIDLRANVQKQEVMLEPMLSANPPDTTKAMAQIDKVAEARAELEKANAKMLLGIRGVLTPDQWTKLSTRGGQGGPGGPDGPGGGQGRGRGPQAGATDNLVEPDLDW
jgi:Spy/CpxP family protein refolding chaperone